MKLIELKGISKVFGFADAENRALDSVDLTIDRGEFVAIMGPSGSGKSTLMHILGLIDTPTEGSYRFDGVDVSSISTRTRAKRRRRDIGFIFQSFNLLGRLTVIENVAMPLFYDRQRHLNRMKKAAVALEKVGISDKEYYYPEHLSGGQRQKAAIARAIVNKPSVILADEPTGSLDSANSKVIMDLLHDAHQSGNTIIMVTHDYDLAQYAQRVIRFRDGRITDDGILEEGSTEIKTGDNPKSSAKKKRKPAKTKSAKATDKKTTSKASTKKAVKAKAAVTKTTKKVAAKKPATKTKASTKKTPTKPAKKAGKR